MFNPSAKVDGGGKMRLRQSVRNSTSPEAGVATGRCAELTTGIVTRFPAQAGSSRAYPSAIAEISRP
jgi:hypothetical protein